MIIDGGSCFVKSNATFQVSLHLKTALCAYELGFVSFIINPFFSLAYLPPVLCTRVFRKLSLFTIEPFHKRLRAYYHEHILIYEHNSLLSCHLEHNFKRYDTKAPNCCCFTSDCRRSANTMQIHNSSNSHVVYT